MPKVCMKAATAEAMQCRINLLIVLVITLLGLSLLD